MTHGTLDSFLSLSMDVCTFILYYCVVVFFYDAGLLRKTAYLLISVINKINKKISETISKILALSIKKIVYAQSRD